jgi:hypothetical protein
MKDIPYIKYKLQEEISRQLRERKNELAERAQERSRGET